MSDPAGELFRAATPDSPPWSGGNVPVSRWVEFTKPIVRPAVVDAAGVHRMSRFRWQADDDMDGIQWAGLAQQGAAPSAVGGNGAALPAVPLSCRLSPTDAKIYHMTRNHVGGWRGQCGSMQMQVWEMSSLPRVLWAAGLATTGMLVWLGFACRRCMAAPSGRTSPAGLASRGSQQSQCCRMPAFCREWAGGGAVWRLAGLIWRGQQQAGRQSGGAGGRGAREAEAVPGGHAVEAGRVRHAGSKAD